MAQKIVLAAILMRQQKIVLVRQPKDTDWELPSGTLTQEHPTTEDGMTDILNKFGITTKITDSDFYETTYVQDDGGHTVYNLYTPSNWDGEIRTGKIKAEWFGFTDPVIQKLPLPVFESVNSFFRTTNPNASNDISLSSLDESEQLQTRHVKGLDVLRTLQNGDPQELEAQLKAAWGDLSDDIIDFALGEVWASPGLDRRTRSLITVGITAALGGRPQALSAHLKGALNHGASQEEISETLRMVAVYAGFPAALEGWEKMKKVTEEQKKESTQ